MTMVNTPDITPALAAGHVEFRPDLWVLLWSQSQNALHVEPLARMLDSNRAAYAENRRMDYVPLVLGTKDLIQGVANSVRGTLAARDRAMEDTLQ